MAKRTDPRIVIKEHRPWRGWLFSIVLITVSGIGGWLLSSRLPPLLLEQTQGTPQSPALSSQEQLPHLQQENIRLRERLARLQRELEVEQHARADLSANLVNLQDEILGLKRQLATYKGLVKSLEEKGLHIQDLTLSKTATERLLHYRLVLTQGRRVDRLTQGQVHLAIQGVLDGKPARLGLDTLSKGIPLMFKFKYFQILEGELLLPRNFKPTQVKVALIPKDNPSQLVEQTFDWRSLGG
ncbi:conserved hypothetical protein [Nitrosococcus halophilus Nc 4]|uniref:Uncharacterized protein n=1 Tax=Nitrosococcus halophilus (strain Nc4) TaxID=472759 RepID=D5C202_NITHN|nr:DUF6776 family protein [Nitrosococcus halophilus]ADE16590.1 conserved hypothetical protein [Nitrosococcus halophilus Nc 4]